MRLAVFALVVGCAAAPLRSTRTSKQAHARECESASDCVLAPRTCCGHCGAPTSGDIRSIPRASADTAHERHCADTDCPQCVGAPDAHLVATCSRTGACGVIDLATSPITACATDADCIVRPLGCCECGARDWIGVNRAHTAEYQRRVCGDATACPECVGAPPATAVCRAHRCALDSPPVDSMMGGS